ncbi:putative RNA-directed DNA polymerase from transposon X-element [Nephila pilipes]|uniref:Putative RNA-directed DNA polymerase from transposon X-element n=1 Tax=Nephila pilipes TaxID=299642 RepID=A0A8X6QFR5_NEPPI|nr:putative RNA-directed DNA polymerase from transposon X-element [Nephila pilipes]
MPLLFHHISFLFHRCFLLINHLVDHSLKRYFVVKRHCELVNEQLLSNLADRYSSFLIAIVGTSKRLIMDTSPLHDMMSTKLPAEKASIEGILKAMETTATADGLLHIANCVEANLSESLANPHQSDEATKYIIDLHEILDEVRIRYAHTREKEIALESNRLRDCLHSWGIIKQPEAQFTPVKGKNKTRKNTDHQAAKKPRTEELGCSNRFSSLTIEDNEEETDMDAGETTPMPSPSKSQKSIPRPSTSNKIPRRQMALPITIDNVRNGATLLKALQDLTKETKLKPASTLNLPNFTTHRTDRTAYAGGGTALLMRNSLPHHATPLQTTVIEGTAITLERKNKASITIVSIYKSPRKPILQTDLTNLFANRRDVLVIGDLNAKHHTWNPNGNNSQGKQIFEYAKNKNLRICAPAQPTRLSHRFKNAVIDICIAKGNEDITAASIPALSSDHNPVLFTIEVYEITKNKANTIQFSNWNVFQLQLKHLIPGNPKIFTTQEIDLAIKKTSAPSITTQSSLPAKQK